ncbi:MAG: glucokinase [Gemmatimonadota bacterium]
MRVLAGDIGGTTARLALAEVDDDGVTLLEQRNFASASYAGLAPIVREFLADVRDIPRRACFGVPCPVTEGVCEVANLHWKLELHSFRAETGLPFARLINDFAALGHAIPILRPADIVEIKAGIAEPRGPIAVIGAGTGLGQGALLWHSEGYQVVASEGGHADYAARTAEEIRLLTFLGTRFTRVSWERILSGPGILNLYQFLAETGFALEDDAVRAEFSMGDPAAVISRHALDGTDALAVRAMEMFVSSYGAQAGNVALTYRALGGVFLGGGIAPRILNLLREASFASAFAAKGRLSPMIATIPVYVVVHPTPGLLGAASVAARIPLAG